MPNDMLVIKKVNPRCEDYLKTLKVSPQNHDRVKNLAEMTGRQINEVANTLVQYALDRVIVEE